MKALKGKKIKIIIAAIIIFCLFAGAFLMAVSTAIMAGGANKSKGYDLGSLMDGLPEMITEEMVIGAIESQVKYGVPAALTIAQIILESSGDYPGGLSQLAYECNNLFGMKGVGPAGSKEYSTKEESSNGTSYVVTAKFRKYNNIKESIEDHAKVLTTGRFAAYTAKAKTSDDWAKAVHKAGYATDKNYAVKVISLMTDYDLYRFDNLTLDNFKDVGIEGDGAATGKFLWPVKVKARITSPFGNRVHPIYGTVKFHSGIDIGIGMGKDVIAADGGTVSLAAWNGGYGKCVIIDHGGGFQTLYAHNSQLCVRKGQKISKGQVISKVGSTGNSTGPHLHFEVKFNGTAKNPLDYVKQPN